jgi:large subunit ribosomal protein L23
MEFSSIIIQPYQTEKTYAVQNNSLSQKFVFLVNPKASKNDIAIAFQSIYGYKPASVKTQLRKPTHVRTGTAHPGFSKLYKIAYISLAKGTKINSPAEVDNAQVAAQQSETPIVNDNTNISKKEVEVSSKHVTESTAVKKEVVKEMKSELEDLAKK